MDTISSKIVQVSGVQLSANSWILQGFPLESIAYIPPINIVDHYFLTMNFSKHKCNSQLAWLFKISKSQLAL